MRPIVSLGNCGMTEELNDLTTEIGRLSPLEAAERLEQEEVEMVVNVLGEINPLVAQQILHEMEPAQRESIMAAAPAEKATQWTKNEQFPEDSVGWLMESPAAVFRPTMTVQDTIEALRKITKRAFITYGYVTDASNKLLGILVMRDLMLAEPGRLLSEVMYTDVFTLRPEMELTEAMKETVNRHYPVYPVCDASGSLLGLVRGQNLFEARAIEISAQAGSMVGVEKEERLSTPLVRSLKFRHPWLQINLLTCFAAAAVVGFFSQTLDRIVLLAVFLPVVAGQSGNTGCQALAVALRGLTLGDLKNGDERRLVIKEGLLGLVNGALVGISAGLGMWVYATMQGNANALVLGGVVWIAMVASCIVSGLCGALIPLLLRRVGADPATASSIFLTTVTDVVSMGAFLGLATILIP